MAHKEKAKQLVEQFYLALPNNGSFTGINSIHNRWKEGKQCAIIAVNEILNTIEYSSQADELSKTTYWNTVKQEIEQL